MAYNATTMEKWLNLNVSPFLKDININRSRFNTPITCNWHPNKSVPIKSEFVPMRNNCRPDFSFRGFNDNDRRICVVLYEMGRIVCCRTYSSYFCISFEFSGCYMARFKYDGVCYACHIYKNSSSNIDCKDLWNNFIDGAAAQLSDVILFNPFLQSTEEAKKLRRNSEEISICGIITTEGNCFTSILNHREANFIETKKAANVPIVTPMRI